METPNGVTCGSAPNKPERHSCVCKKCVVAILIILVAGVICGHLHRPKLGLTPGRTCVVQFRRDILGGATNSPGSPTAARSEVCIQGRLIAVNREAILIKSTDLDEYWSQIWIPKSSILLIMEASQPDKPVKH